MKNIPVVLLILLITISTAYFLINESLPQKTVEDKTDTTAANLLANKMLTAINKPAWDNIRYIQWSFKGKRHFIWDKEKHLVQVRWKEYCVLINPNTATGVAFEQGVSVKEGQAQELVEKAIDAFNNDSFWLNAPAKVYDQGTERSIVIHEEKEALLVKYTSGGSTPGDSYLWILDDNGLPIAYKMWVSIIPIGGIEFSWEKWREYDGAMISQVHKNPAGNITISDIKTGSTAEELGIQASIFDALLQ